MRSHSQTMMITLAITFAMALALTVALICISHVKSTPFEEYTEPATEESLSSTSEPLENDTLPPPPLPQSGLRFSSNGDGTCVLSGVGDCSDSSVVIPEFSPTGERVTEIATMAFYRCETVTAVQIPASVTHIGKLAFADCKKLAEIYIPSSVTSIGYGAFDNCSAFLVVKCEEGSYAEAYARSWGMLVITE